MENENRSMMTDDFKKLFEASKALYAVGEKMESEKLLRRLWESAPVEFEFILFRALFEVHLLRESQEAWSLLNQMIEGDPEWFDFWQRRSLDEQSMMFEWHGEFAFRLNDFSTALDSLTRAASLGRESASMWLMLGQLNLEKDDLDMSIRYLRRSLELFRQPGFDIFYGQEDSLGFFVNQENLEFRIESKDYMKALLRLLEITKGSRSVRSVRDFVQELTHQFPKDSSLKELKSILDQKLLRRQLNQMP